MTSQNHHIKMTFFFFHQTNKKEKKTQTKHEKSSLRKNIIKTNEISTFPPPRSAPRTTPDDQNHPRAPPGPPPGTLRKLDLFSVPPKDPPRTPESARTRYRNHAFSTIATDRTRLPQTRGFGGVTESGVRCAGSCRSLPVPVGTCRLLISNRSAYTPGP